ncbi:MAG: CheR family methyltransferase [Polyangiaceae bacterium]
MTTRDKTIERVLEAAERRFGLGAIRGPGWVRDRVGAFVDAYVERVDVPWEAVAAKLVADRASMNELIASLRVGETRFLRDSAQWEAIVRHLCEKVPSLTPIHALSAGCSTGEEAYTLALLLSERKRRFQIVGVDRSPEAIEAARRGRYAAEAVRELPPPLLERYFDPVDDVLRVKESLRSSVKFEVRDLTMRWPRGPFHLVLFKNVLLYLAEPVGNHVASRLANTLAPDGFLISAASESVRLSAILEPFRIAQGAIAFRPRPET